MMKKCIDVKSDIICKKMENYKMLMLIKIRLIDLFLNLILFPLKSFLFFISRDKRKKVLVIKLDAIGDYVLFRNFLKFLREDVEYSKYHITLCGNSIWKDLAVALDNDFVDHFIWIDKSKFKHNLFYTIFKIIQLICANFYIVIHPTHSRYAYVDKVVGLINAKTSIGSYGDTVNISSEDKIICDRFYSKLIKGRDEAEFEFVRNRVFFEQLLSKSLSIDKPQINFNIKKNYHLPDKYVLVFLGGSARCKLWNPVYFSDITNKLYEKHGIESVIAGGSDVTALAEIVTQYAKYKVNNFVGKTDLIDLVCLIKQSLFVVSNETSAVHIGVSLDKDIICISNADHFPRFAPYPPEIYRRCYTVFPPIVMQNIDSNFVELIAHFNKNSCLDINMIKPDLVWSEIEEKLRFQLSKLGENNHEII